MEFYMLVFVFLIFLALSSVMNILFKMTEKKHWGFSVLFSAGLAFVTFAILSQ